MKIRNGFVSNSSSSSFIVIGNNIPKVKQLIDNSSTYLDYYEINLKLYTSLVSDCSDIYGKLSDLSNDSFDGSYDVPYDENGFIEVEGDRGVKSVYIPKEEFKYSDLTKLYNELLSLDNKVINDIINKYRRVFNENS